MYYNARWYDSQVGRFAQADSVISSGIQRLDRYGYTSNNPINRIDPTGHTDCAAIQDTNARLACQAAQSNSSPSTLEDFENMSWAERKAWLEGFAKDNNLGAWFDDMIKAIDFMSNDPTLSRKGGIADMMDAAILKAVNDGWYMYQHRVSVEGGGQGWATFFDDLDKFKAGNLSQAELNSSRLNAEQVGVDYAWNNTADVSTAKKKAGGFEKDYMTIFLLSANSYRSAGIATGAIDPRQVGSLVTDVTQRDL